MVDANTFGLGGVPSTTNQRMEIRAALEAVRALPRPLVVWSDSKYVVNCFEQAWWRKWQANGWKNSKKEPVVNRDLWEPLVVAASTGVKFRWVKGHSGVDLNEVADRLANAGMLGTAMAAPPNLANLVTVATKTAHKRFVVTATWSARCKACGDPYTNGAGVTKGELGWVHLECAPG